MLENLLSISVLAAVLFFGALISIGNERQRKALDGIREQAARWAEQDIRLKRATASRQVRVEDANAWLHGIASRVLGAAPAVLSLTPWRSADQTAVVAICTDGRRLVLTPLPAARFIQVVRLNGKSRASRAEVSLLGDHPGRLPVYELSIVTAGAFFDIEAAQAWSQVTGETLGAERLTMFEVPPASQGK